MSRWCVTNEYGYRQCYYSSVTKNDVARVMVRSNRTLRLLTEKFTNIDVMLRVENKMMSRVTLIVMMLK